MKFGILLLTLTSCAPDLTVDGELNLRFSRAWTVECLSEQDELAIIVVAMTGGSGADCLPENADPIIPSQDDCELVRSIYSDRCRPNVGPLVGTRASIAAWFEPQSLDTDNETINGSANGLWLTQCEQSGALETNPVPAEITLTVAHGTSSTIQIDEVADRTSGNFEAKHCELE
jgi:hypothetical protein